MNEGIRSMHLHLPSLRYPLRIRSNTRFMESYWCEKKNSIMDLMNGKDIPIALTLCLKSECEQWRGGECIQIRKAGKPDKPQVWSTEAL
jgi:hypothetical protein